MKNLFAISCLALGCLIFAAPLQAGWVLQNSGVTASLQDIYFADVNNGWCVGTPHTVLHTTNGGTTWVLQNGRTDTSAFTSYEGICTVSPTTAWFVGSNDSTPDGDIIRKTTDGGTTWFPETSGVHNPAKVAWTGVHFVDANNGWICSGGPVGGGTDQIILKTTDGGNTFTPYSWPGYDGGLNRVFFKDVLHGWACGGTEMTPATRGYAIRSTNGGSTWSLSRRWGAITYGTYPFYSGVHFTDSLRGWLCGWLAGVGRTGEITRRVDRTTDGGLTWTTLWSEVAPLQNIFSDIFFTDSLNGWVVGEASTVGEIRRTTDGGTTWTVDTSGTSPLNAVYFVDVNTGWACGDGGTILKFTGVNGVETPVRQFDGLNGRQLELAVSSPAVRSLALSYTLPKAGEVRLELYDAAGRWVESLSEGLAGPGEQHVRRTTNVPAGVYFVRLSAGKQSLTRKLVVVR